MPQASFIKQMSGSVAEADAVQWPVPAETFQLIDPPKVSTSPEKMVHRDCECFKISATCTTTGSTDTLFAVYFDDLSLGGLKYDPLGGAGVLAAGSNYDEWWLVPRPNLYRMATRISVDVTQVGTGVKGLIFEVLFL